MLVSHVVSGARVLAALCALIVLCPSCATSRTPSAEAESAFLDDLQRRTFLWFWELSDSTTGLTPDRAPTRSFVSVSATGFALTAYPIGVERGFVPRDAAARRVLTTLRHFWNLPQDSSRSSSSGYRGFFYHFLDASTGLRFADVELSTMDTALFMAGALFCRDYFDGDSPVEGAIRAYADSLYRRVDWTWAVVRPPTIGHGWDPEAGHLPYDWRGFNETMILVMLALGSPTHPVDPAAWKAWTSGYRWGTFHGEPHLGFAPLFGHQYSHVWIDTRGIRDDALRDRPEAIDLFENSRRATLGQYRYAIENPSRFAGYGPRLWGLTACDGPLDTAIVVDGAHRRFQTYWARGASFTEIQDDGTICPSAVAASIPFAPEITIPTLMAMRDDHGDRVYNKYGFVDALNPTFRFPVRVQHGRVDPAHGWYDTDQLGIDQGPILAMVENHRSGLVWTTMRRDPDLVRGLRRAGFSGGWLDSVPAGR